MKIVKFIKKGLVKNNKFTCLTATIYNLYVYLLYSSYEEYKSTIFITMNTIPKEVRNNLPNQLFINKTFYNRLDIIKIRIYFVYLRQLFSHFIDKSHLYAQDHLPISPFIIRNNDYSFVEDGPNIFSITKNTSMFLDSIRNKESLHGFRKFRADFLSRASYGIMANNELCREVIVTTDDTAEYLLGKQFIRIDEQYLWNKADKNKKDNILRIFNITTEDKQLLSQRKVIVFTQPFFDDAELTLSEHIKIYENIINKYGVNNIIIKTHPRDTVDYSKYFPEVLLFNKPVPFQLLTLLGIKFQVAVTVCSTAVMSIPYEIKIDWIGADIHPNLLKSFGNIIPEEVKRKKV